MKILNVMPGYNYDVVRKCHKCKKFHEFVVFRYYFFGLFFRVYCFKCFNEKYKKEVNKK